MEFKHLLAKSCDDPDNPPEAATLVGHTKAVLVSAMTFLKCIRISQIPPEISDNWDRFVRLVLIGAALHDIGKATNLFQGVLLKNRSYFGKTHPVRHEILSALLLSIPQSPLRAALNDILRDNEDLWLLSWIIGGHHLKLTRTTLDSNGETRYLVRKTNLPKEFIFLGDHEDINQIFHLLCEAINKPFIFPESKKIMIPLEEPDDLGTEYLETIVEEYLDNSEKISKKLSEEERILLAFAKATLIAADVAGSALTKTGKDTAQWIEAGLNATISHNSMNKLVREKLDGKRLRSFQRQIAGSKEKVTISVAGCGNGKTLAAYVWARTHANGKKLFFCYPTTGTASSGFEDYLLAQTELERSLIHGRSQVDLERILSADEINHLEENQLLHSLQAYSQQVVVCTVDTVLGLIQNHRTGLFCFPAFLNAAFVFDEIHSYDEKLFGSLLKFLEFLPENSFLLMSASIPEHRLRMLEDIVGARMDAPIEGDKELEEVKRYKLSWVESYHDCWTEIKATIENQGKVLWVCNTVNDAINIYEEAATYFPNLDPLLYHSRYRYRDRIEIQEEVLNSFKDMNVPTFAITTQVCEMSLNIDANLMLTSLPPFASLIQRLGRLNRHLSQEVGHCLVYDFACKEGMPYKKKDLQESKRIIKKLLDVPCSQKMLASELSNSQLQEEIYKYSAWIDGAWESSQRQLRKGNSAITVLFYDDLEEIKRVLKENGKKPNFQTLAPWCIPVLYRPEISFAKKFGGYPVVGDDCLKYEYNSQTKRGKGARWRNEKWLMY